MPQSVIALALAAPTLALTAWVGYQLRPLLAPITLRAGPLSPQAKGALALGPQGMHPRLMSETAAARTCTAAVPAGRDSRQSAITLRAVSLL